MYKLECAQVWGGIEEGDAIIASPGFTAALFSSSGQGDKGGDVYYLTLCNSACITRVAIADVVGHGEVVSQMSQSLYNSLEQHVDSLDGSDVLADLNRDAIKKGIQAMSTAIVATYYRENKCLAYTSAGHPPMLLKRRHEKNWHQVETRVHEEQGMLNIPLSVTEDARYVQESIGLGKGDRVLIYTDGLLETRSADSEAFGMKRLLGALKAHPDKKIDEVRNDLVSRLKMHAGNAIEHDDVTFLLMEIG